MKHKVTVLIVDDSRIFRTLVEKCLEGENDIEVIGSVRNGVKALEFLAIKQPDLITLDLEMPDMNGLETLEAIQKINLSNKAKLPIGVIMLSAFTQKDADITIKALETGAFDFIAKPEEKNAIDSFNVLKRQLVMKIRYFASKKIASSIHWEKPLIKNTYSSETSLSKPVIPSKIKAVLIGVSTGGPKALMTILPDLCKQINIPVFVVQHMPPTFTQSLANSLDAKCCYSVIEGQHNNKIQPNFVYIAPGGRHMLLRKQGNNTFIILNDQAPEKGCRPSVNVLFRSAFSVYGGNLIAVILTGMGSDGTSGIKMLKRAGSHIIVQDEPTSVVWGMPGSAVASGCVDQVLPLHEIPDAIADLIHKSGNK